MNIQPDDYENINDDEIRSVIQNSGHLRLALDIERQPYIIPVCFTAENTEEGLVFYIQCKGRGKKMECISKNPRVALELENTFDKCISSVLVFGRAQVLETEASSDNKETVTIKIIAESVSGRKYYDNARWWFM